jgi:hypothetical protein
MIKTILFILLIQLYWFAEGATEGYTWADREQRMENVIVKGRADGNGILDYHGWRFMEVLGIYGATLLGILSIRKDPTYIWLGIGSIMAGTFVYERVLNYVVDGTIFKEPGWQFYIAGLKIPRYSWQDITLLIVGIGFIVAGYTFRFTKKE